MDETFTASTETAAPAVSSVVDAPATSASGTGAGEQQAATPVVQDANAPNAADDQIDVGWSLEDGEAQQQALPDDDADIEQMLQDPNLDPARTPALVENLRNLRKEYRDLNTQLRRQSEAVQAFEAYGGPEGALGLLQQFDQLAYNPQESALPFLEHLALNARPAYDAIAETLVREFPDYVIEQLQASGKLPSQFSQVSASEIDPAVFESVPQHLQDIYKKQPAEARAELDLMTDAARNHFLEREAKLDRLDATQRQQAEQQWHSQVEQAKQAGRTAVESLSGQFEQAHYQQLAKWQPFGPESQAENKSIYDDVVNGALNELLSDQKFAQMYQDAAKMLRDAPLRRLHNEGLAAGQDEIKARQMAMQFNARLGQVIKARVERLDSVFRDARAFREQQRQAAPQRTEISGQSAQIANGKGVAALDSRGQISAQYLDDLARRHNLGARQ